MTYTQFSGNLMTLSEVSSYLKVAEKTVLRMIQKGEIPCVKIASQWRFDKGLIDKWIMSRMSSPGTDDLTKLMQIDAESVPLSRLTSEEFIITNIPPGSIESILYKLALPLLEANLISNTNNFVNKLLSRENMISTALGNGIAMPHIRNPVENKSGRPVVVIGVCPEGTNFNAADKKDVYVFFLVFTNNEIAHLRIISKISIFLRNNSNLKKFIDAKDSKEIYNYLLEST